MKQIFLTASIAVLLCIACTNKSSTADTGATSQMDSNMANNLKIYPALQSGNVQGLDSLMASDVVDHDGPMGKDVKGKDSIMKMVGDMHNHFKDLKIDVISSAANGDYIFTLVHITGTVSDSTMGKPGEKVDTKSVDVVRMKDNKFVEHWGFSDDSEVQKQMMAMQKK